MLRLRPMTVLILSFATACASSSPPLTELPPELRRAVITSAHNPDVALPTSGSFRWFASPEVHGDLGAEEWVDPLIRETITEQLRLQGFWLRDTDTPDLLVHYIAVSGDNMNSAALERVYGLERPGWLRAETAHKKYDRGAIIIDIWQARSMLLLWRGTLEGVAAPDLPMATRHERLRQAITYMLLRFANGT